jgi:Leucine-rich repeat (LRR) protein
LSGFGLRNLPEEVSTFAHLQILNLSNNQLEELPQSLENLKNLKKLDISNNPIKKTPPFVWFMMVRTMGI